MDSCVYLKRSTVVLILSTLCLLISCGYGQNTECVRRDFDEDSFVCVCNSTYCDEIGTVDRLAAGQYVQYVTSKDALRFDKNIVHFSLLYIRQFPFDGGRVTLTIDHNKINQTILGFGGAFTDAAGQNLVNLSNGTQQNLIDAYFSQNGLQYSIGRVPIGGCDFSPRPYSYDDDQPGDFNLTSFQLAPEDLQYKIPMVQRALAVSSRPVKMFASPWSAPGWMKTSGSISGNGTLLGEVGGLYYQTWADYFVRFLDEYSKHGIEFWAVTAQNEPTDGLASDFPFNCMGFTAETQREFIATNLGPTLEASGYGDVNILMLDDQRTFLPSWPKEVLRNDSTARDYVDGIAFHWYLNAVIPPSVLLETHDLFPDAFLLSTEACAGSEEPVKVKLGNWERGQLYATDILTDLHHWTVGWVDWNMALNTTGGYNWGAIGGGVDSSIIVDADLDEFYKQPMFYAIGHFSKFVAPGSVVIGMTSSSSSDDVTVKAIAFDNPDDESTVVVVLNNSNDDVEVVIEDPNVGFIHEIIANHSFQTFIWWK